MFSIFSTFDFWRAFIAVFFEYLCFLLIVREQERINSVIYQMKIEAEIKRAVDSVIDTKHMQEIKEQIKTQIVEIDKLKIK